MNLCRLSLFRFFSAMALLTLLAGCAGHIRPEAFGQNRKFAVVTLTAMDAIENTRPEGLSGGIQALAGKNSGFGASAKKVHSEAAPLILKEFGKAPHFRLLPEKTVVDSKAYKGIEADAPPKALAFLSNIITPQGYKLLGKEKCVRLAQGLAVDGVLAVDVRYICGNRTFGVAGLAARKNTGLVEIQVTAYDRNGQVIWKDKAHEESAEGYMSMGAVDFQKLHPLLLEAASKAARTLVEKLDTKLKG